MPVLKWRKSSYSEASGNACVEIAGSGDLVAVRDSKHPELPSTTMGREAWAHFTDALGKGLLS
ncbi:DUF397 domain-containing protein [Streptomyces alboflavus]|uniref:DUF397 domain-containing protein n=1 Tax=Streptomyces alboflavus TaxID=67267 RepID=UPI000F657331|nr:DUF397 domain-containing protein [Streptomyces alboflavus]